MVAILHLKRQREPGQPGGCLYFSMNWLHVDFVCAFGLLYLLEALVVLVLSGSFKWEGPGL